MAALVAALVVVTEGQPTAAITDYGQFYDSYANSAINMVTPPPAHRMHVCRQCRIHYVLSNYSSCDVPPHTHTPTHNIQPHTWPLTVWLCASLEHDQTRPPPPPPVTRA